MAQSPVSYQSLITNKFPSEPEEGFFKVIIGLGGNVVVLQVLLAVEGDGLGLHLPFLNVDLVTTQNDRDVFADTDEVA
jgi:hypothetical protein